MSIHTKIAELRQAKGWSQQRLADEISRLEGSKKGMSYSTVQQWEAGRTAPKRTRLPFVAQALGTPLQELVLAGPALTEGATFSIKSDAEAALNVSAWPFKTLSPAELAKLPPETVEQLERVMCAFVGVQMPVVHWRPIALRVAAELDKHRRNDEFTTFVRAVDFEIERELGKLQPTDGAQAQEVKQ